MGPGIGFRDKSCFSNDSRSSKVMLQWGPELGSGIRTPLLSQAAVNNLLLQWGPELGSGIRMKAWDEAPWAEVLASMGPGIGFRDKRIATLAQAITGVGGGFNGARNWVPG